MALFISILWLSTVLKNTLLEQKFLSGEYIPPTLGETVEICAQLMDIFEKNYIRIIKMGLHADTGLEGKIVAGPYHPAFRELCISQRFLYRIKSQLTNKDREEYIIKVNPKELSQWKGQKNSKIKSLGSMGLNVHIVADSAVPKDEFTID